jgi:hypothetical protein
MGKSQAEKLRNDVEKQLREFEKLDSTSMYFALLAIDGLSPTTSPSNYPLIIALHFSSFSTFPSLRLRPLHLVIIFKIPR